jgi:hypothetical protein
VGLERVWRVEGVQVVVLLGFVVVVVVLVFGLLLLLLLLLGLVVAGVPRRLVEWWRQKVCFD